MTKTSFPISILKTFWMDVHMRGRGGGWLTQHQQQHQYHRGLNICKVFDVEEDAMAISVQYVQIYGSTNNNNNNNELCVS